MTHEELHAIRGEVEWMKTRVGDDFSRSYIRDVTKLLDYINELENMPLIQTVKEQEKEIERLQLAINELETIALVTVQKRANQILTQTEGESHANL